MEDEDIDLNMPELVSAAKETIDVVLKTRQVDYSQYSDYIKHTFNFMYDGNWESSLQDENGVTILRFCQEDEFDQHVDRSGYDGWEVIGYAGNHYVFFPCEGLTYTLNPEEEDFDDWIVTKP